jgi:excisionase family DNA binding protein
LLASQGAHSRLLQSWPTARFQPRFAAHTTKILEINNNEVGTDKLAFTVKEAAAMIGVSPTSIRRAIARCQLKACRKFRHVLITRGELLRFLGEQ